MADHLEDTVLKAVGYEGRVRVVAVIPATAKEPAPAKLDPRYREDLNVAKDTQLVVARIQVQSVNWALRLRFLTQQERAEKMAGQLGGTFSQDLTRDELERRQSLYESPSFKAAMEAEKAANRKWGWEFDYARMGPRNNKVEWTVEKAMAADREAARLQAAA